MTTELLIQVGVLLTALGSCFLALQQQLRAHRKFEDEKLDGLSKDIEGNTRIILQVQQNTQNLVERLDKHEEGCRERWARNWDEHKDMNTRLAKIEGRTGTE